MKKKHFLGVVLGILCLDGVGQNVVDTSYYYYYRGEKQYIVGTMIYMIPMIFKHKVTQSNTKKKSYRIRIIKQIKVQIIRE